jgi:hypothetical protein
LRCGSALFAMSLLEIEGIFLGLATSRPRRFPSADRILPLAGQPGKPSWNEAWVIRQSALMVGRARHEVVIYSSSRACRRMSPPNHEPAGST